MPWDFCVVTWSEVSCSGLIGEVVPIPAMKSKAETGAVDAGWLEIAGGYIIEGAGISGWLWAGDGSPYGFVMLFN